MATNLPSIHKLKPLEIGGVVARHGFAVQDHVAAGFCLDMLEDQTLTQVWCETQDDVTLIWLNGTAEEIEFVQVKSNELDQLWTIAKLLEKERIESNGDGAVVAPVKKAPKKNAAKKKPTVERQSHCILEKSLQYDRCGEPVRFRIVTCQSVKSELKVLTYELGSEHRDPNSKKMADLISKIKKQLTFKSSKGNGCDFWCKQAYWVVIHSLESICNQNILKLARLVEAQGQYLAMDQLDELYQRLVTKVFDGGLAKWDKEAGKKKILRKDLLQWFANAVADAVHPGYHGTGKKLEEKLKDAGIPEDQYESIAYLRLQYRSEGLTPKYAELKRRKQVEGSIYAKLHCLRTHLDGKEIEEDGRAFHARCISVIDEVRKELPEDDRPPVENLYGYMYNLADRCVHRFVRAKT